MLPSFVPFTGPKIYALLGLCLCLVSCAHTPAPRDSPPAPRQVQHPELGLLVADNTLWSGELPRDGHRLRFVFTGTTTAPEGQPMETVRRIVQQFSDVERLGLNFLREHEPEARRARLDFYMLIVGDREHPANFTLQFTVDGDAERIWSVDFESGTPVHSSYDD